MSFIISVLAQNVDTKLLPRTPHSLGKVVYENAPDSNIKYVGIHNYKRALDSKLCIIDFDRVI